MSVEHNQINPETPPKAYLVIGQQVFSLDREVTDIGRGKTNHLVIRDLSVSRQHAQIRIENEAYVISDAQSRWGTWVNNKEVSSCELSSGDLIHLASLQLKFVYDGPEIDAILKKNTGTLIENPIVSVEMKTRPTLPP
jgi:pSer/pThr/pTyr-binding forkhead associated (FHA) protein